MIFNAIRWSIDFWYYRSAWDHLSAIIDNYSMLTSYIIMAFLSCIFFFIPIVSSFLSMSFPALYMITLSPDGLIIEYICATIISFSFSDKPQTNIEYCIESPYPSKQLCSLFNLLLSLISYAIIYWFLNKSPRVHRHIILYLAIDIPW